MPSPACRNLSGLKKNFIYKVSIVTKLIAIFLLAISTYAYAKEFTPPPNDVTGKVTNDKGEPLVGATVTEKGTKNSEVTKEDGSFAMRTSTTKPVFVISYIGYETKEFPAGIKPTSTWF